MRSGNPNYTENNSSKQCMGVYTPEKRLLVLEPKPRKRSPSTAFSNTPNRAAAYPAGYYHTSPYSAPTRVLTAPLVERLARQRKRILAKGLEVVPNKWIFGENRKCIALALLATIQEEQKRKYSF